MTPFFDLFFRFFENRHTRKWPKSQKSRFFREKSQKLAKKKERFFLFFLPLFQKITFFSLFSCFLEKSRILKKQFLKKVKNLHFCNKTQICRLFGFEHKKCLFGFWPVFFSCFFETFGKNSKKSKKRGEIEVVFGAKSGRVLDPKMLQLLFWHVFRLKVEVAIFGKLCREESEFGCFLPNQAQIHTKKDPKLRVKRVFSCFFQNFFKKSCKIMA